MDETIAYAPLAGRQTIGTIAVVGGDHRAAHAAAVEHALLGEALPLLAAHVDDDEEGEADIGLVEVYHEVDVAPDALEELALAVLDASGAERVVLSLDPDPDLHRNVSVAVRGSDRAAVWMRHLTAREIAGGETGTRADRAARMGVDAASASPPTHVLGDADDRKTFAAALRDALRRDAGLDLPTSRAEKAIAAAVDGEGVLDVGRAAAALAASLAVPARVVARFVEGARRRGGPDDATFEAGVAAWEANGAEWLATLHGRSGDILANPGFQRLVRDVRDRLRDDGSAQAFELAATDGDPRLAALCLVLFASWAQAAVSSMEGTDRTRSDEYQLARAVVRGVEEGDAHALGDRHAQVPRTIADDVLDDLLEVADAIAPAMLHLPGGPDVDLSLAATLATEPALGDHAAWNYGPRWRRLDAPDLLMLSRADDSDLLGRAWVRTTSRRHDPDLRAIGIDEPLSISGESEDHDDSIWIVGVGPHPWAVAPLLAAGFVRDMTTVGHLEVSVGEFQADAGALATRARVALARTMASQTLDDVGAALARSPTGITMRVSSMNARPDAAGMQDNLPMAYMLHLLSATAGITGADGRPLVRMIDDQGRDVTARAAALAPPRSADDDADPTEMVRLHAVVGRGVWGAVAVVSPDEPTAFVRVAAPAVDEIADARAMIEDEELDDHEIVDEAATEADIQTMGDDDGTSMLKHALATHGRAMLVVLGDFGENVGADFADPMPGEDVADALGRILSRHRAGHAPAWDLADLHDDDMDDLDADADADADGDDEEGGMADHHRIMLQSAMPMAEPLAVTMLDAPMPGLVRGFGVIGDEAACRRFREAMSDLGIDLGEGTREPPFVRYDGGWRGTWQLHVIAQAMRRVVQDGGLESAMCMGVVATPRGAARMFGIVTTRGDDAPFVVMEPD